MGKQYKRKHPNGMPLHLREPRFTSQQTGRLTHTEYNVIDMSRKTHSTDMKVLCTYMSMTHDAALRLWNRMKHCGLVTGGPSAFVFTTEALDAFKEADRWMIEPETRPVSGCRAQMQLGA